MLRTVINAYPIRGTASQYPANSIQQIAGAFSRTHRVGGRLISLEGIEKQVLPQFDDPRVYFALGRGSVGGGRLRSEAFTAARVEQQLAAVAAECVQRNECFRYDPAAVEREKSANADWPVNRGDPKGNQYVALAQINATNVHKLRPAWEYHAGDATQRGAARPVRRGGPASRVARARGAGAAVA